MNLVVLSALVPVISIILVGLVVGRAGWLGPAWASVLSRLTFLLLTPVLLFRAMGRVDIEQLDPTPLAVYSAALVLVFAGVMWRQGFDRRAAVLALAATYGNSVMIGIPLVVLLWGETGLVTLFTLVPIHSLLLLTSATVLLEFAAARDGRQHGDGAVAVRLWQVGLRALGKALWHPVPVPILAGLLFAQTGWVIPPWLDLPMSWLGKAFAPLALFLVGVSLSSARIGSNLVPALRVTAAKNLLLPLLAGVIGWAAGMPALPWSVMVVTAALPTGVNAYLFAQQYGVAQQEVTASVAVSTALAAASVSLVLLLVGPR